MIKIRFDLQPVDLKKKVERLWELSAAKITATDREDAWEQAGPVFTREGKYCGHEQAQWTHGFFYGSALLQFDAFWDDSFLRLGRDRTIERMGQSISHVGSDTHGFNVVSTYGNLWRLMGEGRIPSNERERDLYEMAVRCSGAVQANRWTNTFDGDGFIHSARGPHSLAASSMRSLRVLALSHKFGHRLRGERDVSISLMQRLIEHARTVARYSIYHGKGRDSYDVPGRTAEESVFDVIDGRHCGPGCDHGYSPFSTWTRGLAWTMCGFAEQLEFLETLKVDELKKWGGRDPLEQSWLEAAQATADFYIASAAADGIPYWDTGAALLHKLGDYLDRPANPNNDFEPVDSSAAGIAAQALLRLGHYLTKHGGLNEGKRYWQAGLTILNTLFEEPYLNVNAKHQGLILHAVYHRPNGWDYVTAAGKIPSGESTIWGDYHAREVALYIQRIIENKPYLTFFGAYK